MILQKGCNCVDVAVLIAVGIAGRVRRAGAYAEGIVVGDVGREAAQRGGSAGVLVYSGEELGGRADVGGPSKPAGVSCECEQEVGRILGGMHTGIDIHGDIGQVQLDERIIDTLQIGALGVGAFGHVQVGDQIGQAVGFWRR